MNIDISKYKLPTINIPYKKIFLLSDLHFGVRANSIEWIENQLSFFNDFYIPLIKEKKRDGDILFVLGDWFDNRQFLDINVMNKSIDIVSKLSNILPVYFMTGNHDIYKKNDTDVNSLIAFKFIPNVKIFEEPLIITNGKTKILVLTWTGNEEIEEEYAKANVCDYIFAHTDIAGFKYDNGFDIKKGARLQKIPGVKRLYSGHIHKRQEHKGSVYIGSPYSTKRSDIGNKKGVYIIDTETDYQEFIPNTFSPIFQRIQLEELIEMTLEKAYKILENNYTDIIVPDKYIHLFNLTKFIDLLSGCNYKRIETRTEKNKFDDSFSEILNDSEIKDIITLLENNIDSLDKNPEIINKLKSLNKEYYEKAKLDEVYQDNILN
ncbi:MAG TPA: metallophosphoesterase [Candidatus Diapherotrites archaeon]|nr:metallophosphoesterase [Candidatus Diapherotrites archaeon]